MGGVVFPATRTLGACAPPQEEKPMLFRRRSDILAQMFFRVNLFQRVSKVQKSVYNYKAPKMVPQTVDFLQKTC
jgi:hypothetical protein